MGMSYPFRESDSAVLLLFFACINVHVCPFVQCLESHAPILQKGQTMYFRPVEFGKRVQELRKLNGLTQEELAVKIGVEKLHISRMERGVTACSIDLLLDLSSTLRVSTDYLLTGKNPEKEITRTQLLSVISQLSLIAQSI